jgi:HK97 gp10 family phage protein
MAYGNEAVRGLAQAKRAFKALPDIAREALADATEETAEHIRAGAVRRVPVRFGFLRDAIAKTMSRRTGVAKVGITRGTHITPDGSKVDPARYGHLQEFGSEHNPAHPFVLPAAEEQKDPYLRRAKDAGKTIERDMGALGTHLT